MTTEIASPTTTQRPVVTTLSTATTRGTTTGIGGCCPTELWTINVNVTVLKVVEWMDLRDIFSVEKLSGLPSRISTCSVLKGHWRLLVK